MIDHLLDCIACDLEAWMPGVETAVRERLARRLADQIRRRSGLAEQRLNDGRCLSWLFDARSGQLLVTYPDGASRIRVAAPPLTNMDNNGTL